MNRPRLSPDERYLSDPKFHALVDVFEHHIREADFTPSELREAAILAAIHYESKQVRRTIRVPSEIAEDENVKFRI